MTVAEADLADRNLLRSDRGVLRIAQIFGALGPAFFGALIGNATSRGRLTWGYVIGGAIMIVGGVIEVVFGANAEGKSLETVTKPLTSVDA